MKILMHLASSFYGDALIAYTSGAELGPLYQESLDLIFAGIKIRSLASLLSGSYIYSRHPELPVSHWPILLPARIYHRSLFYSRAQYSKVRALVVLPYPKGRSLP